VHIDEISEIILGLILKLKERNEGLVSELWIDNKIISETRNKYISINYTDLIVQAKILLSKENDEKRRDYLSKLITSLEYQLGNIKIDDLIQFYKNTIDFELKPLSDIKVNSLHEDLIRLEKDFQMDRHQVLKDASVAPDKLLEIFKQYLKIYKNRLPDYLNTEGNFDYEVVSEAPWGAFNSHVAPYKSKLTLNSAVGITTFDLKHFAVHEAYGGHHTELCFKDKLLVESNRGEHGFVLVYSPQVFISEGIAEAAFELFGYAQDFTIQEKIINAYQNLSFALTNKAVFMYYNDKESKEKIETYIDSFNMGKIGKQNITSFVFDPVFGKYPAIYLSAKEFVLSLYKNAKDKKPFLLDIYKNPCTPTRLIQKYS